MPDCRTRHVDQLTAAAWDYQGKRQTGSRPQEAPGRGVAMWPLGKDSHNGDPQLSGNGYSTVSSLFKQAAKDV